MAPIFSKWHHHPFRCLFQKTWESCRTPPTPTLFYPPQPVNHRQVYSTSVNPQIHPLVFITTVTLLIHHWLKLLQKISKQLSSSPRYSLFRNKTNLYKMPIMSCSWLIPSIYSHCPQNQVQLFISVYKAHISFTHTYLSRLSP